MYWPPAHDGEERAGVKQQNKSHTHTDDVQKKRMKQRDDKRQPLSFVVISITNTHRKKTAGTKREGNRKTSEKNVMNCRSLFLAAVRW